MVGFPGGLVIKNPPANAGDAGSIPGLGRSPGEGNDNPLQVFLPGRSHGQRSLVVYIPWGLTNSARVWHDLATNQQEQQHIWVLISQFTPPPPGNHKLVFLFFFQMSQSLLRSSINIFVCYWKLKQHIKNLYYNSAHCSNSAPDEPPHFLYILSTSLFV